MPSYKLTYFNARGRAELARVLFVLGGQEFEDERIQMQDWPSLKATTPFGQLPVLDVDDKQIAESVAIVNYLAGEFGYYGRTNIDKLAIDQVVCLVQDAINAAVQALFEAPIEDREEVATKFLQEEIPKYFKMLDKLLEANGTGYFVGDSLTLADLSVWDFVSGIENRMKIQGIAAGYPRLIGLFDRIVNLDKLKSYVESRGATDF
ncbi:Glutathione S-transferase 1 [Bulinus truncatus]|nr:Glutathione S-transferase 1 [Bulinus truncatus]